LIAGQPDAFDSILELRGVGYAYNGAWAVKDCTFRVARGRVTGLIGPNGAGKSTLIEMVSGSLRPQSGSIVYEGRNISGCGPAKAAQLGIIRTFQTARMLSRLSVIENVMLAAQGQLGENPIRAMFWRHSWERQEQALRKEALDLLLWVGLRDHAHVQARTLSGGQRRLMEIARALMAHPKLLLLDEPTAGVFPETTVLIAERIKEVVDQHVSVLVIAHNMGFLSMVANDVVVMAEGKVLTRGSLDEVRAHPEVITAYLGVQAVTVPQVDQTRGE
jgi:ABC-type branched-subunit amino acid transport system ATPase component